MGTHSLARKKGPLAMMRNDRPVLERYLEGDDQAHGVGEIGHVRFKPDTIRDHRSCSKSIIGLLYGIALQQRKAPPPEAPLCRDVRYTSRVRL